MDTNYFNIASQKICEDLYSQGKSSDFKGYDPYDGLNSKLFQLFYLDRFRFSRLAWIQLNKLSPINLRPLFLVPKMRNPKGIALFILGLIEDYKRDGDQHNLANAERLAVWLLSNTSNKLDWKYTCWGYHFDWQARAFFVPKGKPNVITTSYVASALYQLYLLTGKEIYQNAVVDSAYFIEEFLLSKNSKNQRFIAYIPGEDAFVHNASLWGAATIARAGCISCEERLKDLSFSVAQLSVKQQRNDGSWVYGERGHHQFVDGFHTGYNLEAIDVVGSELETGEFLSSLRSGLDYYRKHFFLADGTPKYYNDSIYPIDMHSSAQAIITFGKLFDRYGKESDVSLIRRVVEWTMDNMYMESKKAFRYQINSYYKNNIIYTRWTQAWAYYSLAFYNRFVAEHKK